MPTTRNDVRLYADWVEPASSETTSCPPAFLEYIFYVSLAYAMLGEAWGVVIPSLGGSVLALLAATCVLSIGGGASRVFATAAFPIATAFSVLAVQFFFHDDEPFDHSLTFVGWLLYVIVVQALSLRPGFLRRFALLAF